MRTRTLSASLPALRPRVPILAAALLLVVLAVAGLAAPTASAQTPEPISANAATVRVTVPAGASLLGWFGAPTTSSAILSGNDDLVAIWWLDPATSDWQVDNLALPNGVRVTISVNRGTGLFIIASVATTVAVPIDPPDVLGEGSSGDDVSLWPGEALEVLLAGNPTTGFQWEIVGGVNGVVGALGEPGFVVDFIPSDEPLPGVGGHFLFRFMAFAPGATTLELVYRRPFDPPEDPAARTFTLNITVTE
jgi:inhibitor of cysteine peptidase